MKISSTFLVGIGIISLFFFACRGRKGKGFGRWGRNIETLETVQVEDEEKGEIKPQSLDDLRANLSPDEYVKYVSEYYPIMYSKYVSTIRRNRVLSFVIIVIIAFYVLSLWAIMFYYSNKKKKEAPEEMPGERKESSASALPSAEHRPRRAK